MPRTLQFLDFHRYHLNRKTFNGCVWVKKEDGIFKVLWPKAGKNSIPEDLGIIFEWWNLKMGNTKQNDVPSMIKNNYRSCQNSKIKAGELKRRKDLEMQFNDSVVGPFWRYLQFSDEQTPPKTPPGSHGTEREAIERYDPGPVYAEAVIEGEYNEARSGNQKWEITIKALTRGSQRLWEYTYDYAAEGYGTKKLLVYVKGDEDRVAMVKSSLKKLKNLDYSTLNMDSPIEPHIHKVLYEKFSDARDRNPQQSYSRKDTFCPGFILEVDNCLNVYVTRLGLSKLYYGHQGEQNEWRELDRLKRGTRYLDSMEAEDGVKQMVFSYKKFIHTSRVYENWLRDGTPEISLVDSKVLMPVDNVPNIESGCAAGCDFYFEIEHKPATKIYKRIKSFKDALPLSILISDPSEDLIPGFKSQLNFSEESPCKLTHDDSGWTNGHGSNVGPQCYWPTNPSNSHGFAFLQDSPNQPSTSDGVACPICNCILCMCPCYYSAMQALPAS